VAFQKANAEYALSSLLKDFLDVIIITIIFITFKTICYICTHDYFLNVYIFRYSKRSIGQKGKIFELELNYSTIAINISVLSCCVVNYSLVA